MADVDDMLRALERLGHLAEDAAKRAAPLVEEAIRETAAAGTAPDGTPWAPLKKGDGRPLAHAAQAINVKAYGTIVRAVLSGPTVFHHFGGGRNPRRPVLPDPGTVPPRVARAIERAAAETFARAVGS